MPVTNSVRARVSLDHLKDLDKQIDKTGDPTKANGLAVEALDYLRDRGFRIKIDNLEITGEYEIIVFAGFHSKNGKKLITVTGGNFWAAVRSVLFHFTTKV